MISTSMITYGIAGITDRSEENKRNQTLTYKSSDQIEKMRYETIF